MMNLFPQIKLLSVANIISGYAFKSENLTKNKMDIPILKIANVTSPVTTLVFEDHFPREKISDRIAKYIIHDGDVLVAMTGMGSVGRVSIVRGIRETVLLNQRVGIVRGKQNVLDQQFLGCVLTNKHYEKTLYDLGVGAGQPNISPKDIGNLSVSLPPLTVQKKIAAILSAYDDLIETNRRRIALLEKMAEEIYREWFVRMRFPGHEKVRFSKGLPVEWNIRRVKEIVVRKRFGRIYRNDELFDDGKIIVIDQSRSDCLGYYDGEPQHMASPRTPIILFGDHTCKMVLMTKPFSLAENVIPFTPNFNVAPYFLFHLVKDLARTTEYKRHWTDLTNKEVLVPKEDLQLEFESIVKRNHEQIEVLQQVIRKAEKVRDMLLPRLISGKLSVENLDIRFPPSMEEMNHEV